MNGNNFAVSAGYFLKGSLQPPAAASLGPKALMQALQHSLLAQHFCASGARGGRQLLLAAAKLFDAVQDLLIHSTCRVLKFCGSGKFKATSCAAKLHLFSRVALRLRAATGFAGKALFQAG